MGSNRLEGYPPSVLPIVFRVTGPLDVDLLTLALQKTANRHSALRSYFYPSREIARETRAGLVDWCGPRGIACAELYKQFVTPRVTLDVKYEEPGSAGAAGEIDDIAQREIWTRFDPEQPPLMRSTIARLSRDDHLLVTVFDHLVVDAYSLGLFARDLESLYLSLSTRRSFNGFKTKYSFQDFAMWQAASLPKNQGNEAMAYWLRTWRQYEGQELRYHHLSCEDDPAPHSLDYALECLPLDPDGSREICETAKEMGVTAYAFMYAASCVLRSGPRNLDSGLSGISIVFQAAVPKPVVPKYTTSGVRRPSEL